MMGEETEKKVMGLFPYIERQWPNPLRYRIMNTLGDVHDE